MKEFAGALLVIASILALTHVFEWFEGHQRNFDQWRTECAERNGELVLNSDREFVCVQAAR